LLKLEDTRDYAARKFELIWGREATPEQLDALHLPNAPARECDLLCAVEGWIRSDPGGLYIDWPNMRRTSEYLADVDADHERGYD